MVPSQEQAQNEARLSLGFAGCALILRATPVPAFGRRHPMNIYTRRNALRLGAGGFSASALSVAGCASTPELAAENRQNVGAETYSEDEVINAGAGFLGASAAAFGQAVEKVFKDQGRPNAYITGEEGAGALVVGLRFGKGVMQTKSG